VKRDKGHKKLWKLKIARTQPDQFLNIVTDGTVGRPAPFLSAQAKMKTPPLEDYEKACQNSGGKPVSFPRTWMLKANA